MIVNKQPIFSYLLDPQYVYNETVLGPAAIDNIVHCKYLMDSMRTLERMHAEYPVWELPEIIMPSFERKMTEMAQSSQKMDYELFQKFLDDKTKGILITKDVGIVVYLFDEGKLNVWIFRTGQGFNTLYNYYQVEPTISNTRKILCLPTLIHDQQLFLGDPKGWEELYNVLANRIVLYNAVKRFGEKELIVVPNTHTVTLPESLDDYNKKLINKSGQKVIVLDSRWFREIINTNDIPVRGHWKRQNYKNELGEWDWKMIFREAFVRHGYTRKAKLPEE